MGSHPTKASAILSTTVRIATTILHHRISIILTQNKLSIIEFTSIRRVFVTKIYTNIEAARLELGPSPPLCSTETLDMHTQTAVCNSKFIINSSSTTIDFKFIDKHNAEKSNNSQKGSSQEITQHLVCFYFEFKNRDLG